MKRIVKLACLVTLGVLVACAQRPVVEQMISTAPESQGLYPVSQVPFDKLFIKDKQVLGQYSAIYFEELNMDSLEIDQSRLEFRDRPWTLDDDEKEDVKRWFAEEAAKVLKRKEAWSLADAPGDGVLTASFEFLEFTPNASKDDFRGRPQRVHVFTRSVGDLHVRARLTDANSGELIAFLEDEEEVGDEVFLERNDRVNNIRHLKLTLQRWISQLTDTLEAI